MVWSHHDDRDATSETEVYLKTFDSCLENLDKVLQRCEEKHLVLNWEKCHFMVREGIVLGHLVSEKVLR